MQTQNNVTRVTKQDERTFYVTAHFNDIWRVDDMRHITGKDMEAFGS
jgi:hypothetical protein